MCRAAADLFGNDKHQCNATEHDQKQPHAVIQHDGKNRNHGDTGKHQLRNTLRNQLAQRVDIVSIIAHDIAVVMCIKILDRQILHAVEHLFPHLLQRALCDNRHSIGIRIACCQRQRIQYNQDEDQSGHRRRCRRPVLRLPVLLDHCDDILLKNSGNRADQRIQYDADQN